MYDILSVCKTSDNLLHRGQKPYAELDFKTWFNLRALSHTVSLSAEVQVHVPLMLHMEHARLTDAV